MQLLKKIKWNKTTWEITIPMSLNIFLLPQILTYHYHCNYYQHKLLESRMGARYCVISLNYVTISSALKIIVWLMGKGNNNNTYNQRDGKGLPLTRIWDETWMNRREKEKCQAQQEQSFKGRKVTSIFKQRGLNGH